MFGTSSNMTMLGLGPAMNAVFEAARESSDRPNSVRSVAGPHQPLLAEFRHRIAAWCDHLAVNLFRAAIRLEPAAGRSVRPSAGWLES